MQRLPIKQAMVVFLATFLVLQLGCNKKDNGPTAVQTVPTYSVSVTVQDPSGVVQGGALVALQNPPYADPTFQAYTDSSGKATIKSPAGAQTILASIGTAFQVTISVTVTVSTTPLIIAPVRLHQNTALKVLVVLADAEQLEAVLHTIGFAVFDSIYIDDLRDSVLADSAKALAKLRTYSLVFSDCDGGTEGDVSYAPLSRVYGRYVTGGGKMYGGHYNYYHLQRIWTSNYQQFDGQDLTPNDSLQILDANLSSYVGFSVAKWNSTDPRYLSEYEKFLDLPSNAKIYGVIRGTSPAIGVIVENHIGSGKYLWTDYHNQDIKDDVKLVKLVKYFLYSL